VNGISVSAATSVWSAVTATGSTRSMRAATITSATAYAAAPTSVIRSPRPNCRPACHDSSADPSSASAIPATTIPPGRWPSPIHANTASSRVPAAVRNAELPALVAVRPLAWSA